MMSDVLRQLRAQLPEEARGLALADLFRLPTVRALAAAMRADDPPPAPRPRRAANAPTTEPVAVIAMAGRFPGAQTVEALLEHGADTGAADKDGLTALHWATAMGHEGVVRVLVQAGAGLGVTRPNGVSVEDLAHGATPSVRAALGLAP